MEMTSLIIVVLVAIIGILSRYRKCKSDELLVVYGKTGSHKEKVSERDAKGNLVDREVEIKTAKVYHGGAAFVWPIIQGYEVMSMQPIQLNLVLKNALSAQYIDNLGKKEETKARAQSQADIAEEEKKGAIQIAQTTREKEIAIAASLCNC